MRERDVPAHAIVIAHALPKIVGMSDVKATGGILQDVHPELAVGRIQTPRSQPQS